MADSELDTILLYCRDLIDAYTRVAGAYRVEGEEREVELVEAKIQGVEMVVWLIERMRAGEARVRFPQ